MKRFEFASPEVMYVASKIISAPFLHGRTDKNVVIRRQAKLLRDGGLLTHDAGHRVIVTAGEVDVDRRWRRSNVAAKHYDLLESTR